MVEVCVYIEFRRGDLGKRNLEDIGVEGRKTLKRIFEKWNWERRSPD
jgi:hypothetical protein